MKPAEKKPEAGAPAAKPKKKFKMPSAYVIIFFALLVVVVITWFVPVSVHDPVTGEVIYNAAFDAEGNVVTNAGPQPKGLWDLLMAPVQGFISASDVGIALLIAGGFLNVLNVTGGLEAGIGKMLKRLKDNALIALMMLVFAIMGTVFGFWEEITAFALVVVPLFVLAGYDVMTGLAVLFVGASVGNMASVVNPFSAGAAVAAIHNPQFTLGSGIILRSIVFVVLYVVGTLMVARYGATVKKDRAKSVVAGVEGLKTGADTQKEMPEMTPRRLGSVIVFILVVVFLLIGYIPWGDIGGEAASAVVNVPLTGLAKVPVLGDLLGAAHVTPFGQWGFNEFSFLFFIGSLLLMAINRMKADVFIGHFIDGAKDLLGVVLVLAISRGIAIIMGSSTQGMSVTFVYWISSGLSKAPLWIFALLATAAYVLIGLFLQSTSGVAGISMPILGAVAAALFAASAVGAVGGQVILISAFAIGLNFTSSLYPNAVTLGTLDLYNVPYDRYLKFMLKIMIPLLLLGTIIISIAPYIGLAI